LRPSPRIPGRRRPQTKPTRPRQAPAPNEANAPPEPPSLIFRVTVMTFGRVTQPHEKPPSAGWAISPNEAKDTGFRQNSGGRSHVFGATVMTFGRVTQPHEKPQAAGRDGRFSQTKPKIRGLGGIAEADLLFSEQANGKMRQRQTNCHGGFRHPAP
jgi:hypothetical protein